MFLCCHGDRTNVVNTLCTILARGYVLHWTARGRCLGARDVGSGTDRRRTGRAAKRSVRDGIMTAYKWAGRIQATPTSGFVAHAY